MMDMLGRTVTADSPSGESPSESSWTGTATVLVVDDEEVTRWSLVERLSREGYHTLEADTGKEALDQFADGVDLVLLDCRLPDTSGLAVFKEMRRRDPDALVILLTGFSRVNSAVEVGQGAGGEGAPLHE